MANKEKNTIVNLTNDDIIMLNLLDCYAKKEITEDMILHNDPGGITCVAVSEDNPEIKAKLFISIREIG